MTRPGQRERSSPQRAQEVPPFQRPLIQFERNGWSVVLIHPAKLRRTWRPALPVDGSPERLRCWMESLTGVTLDEEGRTRQLDAAGRLDHHRRPEALAGAPLP